MGYILDYIGGIIIGGIVVLALLALSTRMTDSASMQNAKAIVASNLRTASQIIESDVRQMGYRVADSIKVTRADTALVVFRFDVDDNGAMDSVRYFLGTAISKGSANPRTRILYRQINTQPAAPVDAGVTRFRIWYFDGAGASTSQLENIRSIKINLAMQTTLSNDSVNAAVVWEKHFRPMNLN